MLQLILLFGPACVAVLLYERFTPGSRSVYQSALCTVAFALVINTLMYAAYWLRGFIGISWAADASLADVQFCLKHMGFSLVIACLSAAAAIGFENLVRLIKESKKNG